MIVEVNGFGKSVRFKRFEKNISKKSLAEKIGVSLPTIDRWEKLPSWRDIPFKFVERIAEVLNCDPNELKSE